MGRYRTYKNGITGHRYKGYYIIRGEKKGLFQIWQEDKTVFKNNIYDYDDCEWIIDKETADGEELNRMKELYEKEVYQLSAMFVELMQKKEREGLDQDSKKLYKMVEKIRKRKSDEKPF